MSRDPVSFRVLKLLLAVWWWGTLVGAAAVVMFAFFVPTMVDEFAILGYASDIDTSALTAVDRNGKELAISFDSPTRIWLQLPSDDGEIESSSWQRLSGFLLLPSFLLYLLFIKQLRDIVRTIDQHNPFVEDNARRLRVVAVLIFLYVGVECLGRFAMSGYADYLVVPQGFNLDGRIKLNGGLIVVGLAVLVLSEVFRHGSQMREEQSLTV